MFIVIAMVLALASAVPHKDKPMPCAKTPKTTIKPKCVTTTEATSTTEAASTTEAVSTTAALPPPPPPPANSTPSTAVPTEEQTAPTFDGRTSPALPTETTEATTTVLPSIGSPLEFSILL